MVDEETKPIEWIAVVDKDGVHHGAISKEGYEFIVKTMDEGWAEVSKALLRDILEDTKND